MGSLLANDSAASSRLVKSIVRRLRPEEASRVPRHLNCRANVRFYGRRWAGPNRYADFAFYSSEASYLMFLEAKLGSATSQKQVGDYIRVKRESIEIPQGHEHWWDVPRGTTIRVALVGRKAIIARDVTDARRSVTGERARRWLGAATWLEIADLLEDVAFSDEEQGRCWDRLVAHYSGHAGLGIRNEGRLSAEQLLDGSVLRINRSESINVILWNERTEKVVHNRVHGASAFRCRVRGDRRPLIVTLTPRSSDSNMTLEITPPRPPRTWTVPDSATEDVAHFKGSFSGNC